MQRGVQGAFFRVADGLKGRGFSRESMSMQQLLFYEGFVTMGIYCSSQGSTWDRWERVLSF